MKNKLLYFLALILAFGVFASVAPKTVMAENVGTTYYISFTDGDDANDGLSEQAPFKTFKNINNKLLTAGDKVLLKRGDVWNERLEILACGTAENFVEVSAYGPENEDKPTILRNSGDDDICVLVKDFYFDGTRPVQYPFRYLKINNLYLRDARLGIFLRTYACINEEDEAKRNRDVYISDVDIDNMFAPAIKAMIDKEREIEGEYTSRLPREEWPSIATECGERVNALIKEELDKPKCDLPMIENGKYYATGGGGMETIFPAGIFMGGRKPAVYSVTEGAQTENLDKTYPALTNLRVERTNITESCTGIMSWYYYYNGTKGNKIWKNTLTNIAVEDVLVTGSINGGIALDATDGGASINSENTDVLPSKEGWGLIKNLRVLAGSSKDGGTFINGSTGAIINNSKNLSFVECEFAGVNNQNNPDGCGFDFESCNENMKIEGSYFHNNAGGAILIMNSDKGPHKNLLIRNNVLYNNLVDGYNGGPRSWDYEDKRYIQLYNDKNTNINFKNNHILLSRENNQGTPLLTDPFLGPITAPNSGGFVLDGNTVGYFENSKGEKYIPFGTYYNKPATNAEVTFDTLSVNHLIYKKVYIKAENKTTVKGKVSLTTLDGRTFDEKQFETTNGIVDLSAFDIHSAITSITFKLEGTSEKARCEIEFIPDMTKRVELVGDKKIRLYFDGSSRVTLSDEMTKDDFSVNYFGFDNNVVAVDKKLGDMVEIEFEKALTDKQKAIILLDGSINVKPNAYVRIFREIYQGKEPNRSFNERSYFFISELKVNALPTKTTYKVGETLELQGMQVQTLNGNGELANLSFAKFNVVEFDNTTEGEKVVVLKYLDKTYMFSVMVEGNEQNSNQSDKKSCGGAVSAGSLGLLISLACLSVLKKKYN